MCGAAVGHLLVGKEDLLQQLLSALIVHVTVRLLEDVVAREEAARRRGAVRVSCPVAVAAAAVAARSREMISTASIPPLLDDVEEEDEAVDDGLLLGEGPLQVVDLLHLDAADAKVADERAEEARVGLEL